MGRHFEADVTTIIQLKNVGKSYGEVVALRDVDLAIEEGEFVTLLGPSGSGKTTLLNIIAGMVAPSSGEVRIGDRDVTQVPPSKRELGMVFQNYALMPHMTIFDNIAFPLQVRRRPKSEIRRRVAEALDIVRLPETAARKPSELSGGQQQRIALARALVYRPPVILFDEPLGALDRKLREQMQLELKRIHGELGVTMLYVTHDQEEALAMSDRLVLLSQGDVVQAGTPHDLYFNPNSVFSASFLGDVNMFDVTVRAVGADVTVTDSGGRLFRSRGSGTLPVGAAATAAVRPEVISMTPGSGGRSDENHVSGVVENAVVLGGIVKHYVRIDGLGGERPFVVVQLNCLDLQHLSRGATVELSWSDRDMSVLPRGDVEGRLLDAVAAEAAGS